ncbi:MAG: CooT family nickel-binding protein [Dehalococcoidales bacterium]|nr:CooT family nickel-binding protein [Dehalococcoidales bacterium]
MCLSKVYLAKDDEAELVLDEVTSLRTRNGKLLLSTLLGEETEISARIKEIDFLTHRITLEKA